MVYAILVGKLEAQVLADRQVAAVFLAAGAEVQMPTMAGAREQFDADLVAEPAAGVLIDVEEWQLRRALGVA